MNKTKIQNQAANNNKKITISSIQTTTTTITTTGMEKRKMTHSREKNQSNETDP